jgi:hypothetical protein
MTTFHEPPPLSRRAVRQSERGETTETQSAFGPISIQEQPAPQFFSDPSAPREMWDTVARRASSIPQPEPRREAPQGAGRRSSGASPSEPAGEPLTYATQGKPSSVPSYDGPSFRNRQVESDAQPPTQALQKADQPTYRVRDFSPEGRRASSPATAPSWSSPVEQVPAPAVDLDYFTQANLESTPLPRAVVPVPEVFSPTAPPLLPPPAEEPVLREPIAEVVIQQPVLEQTLTRRELRALQARASSAPELVWPSDTPEVVDTLLHSGPIELPLLAPQPEPSGSLASAMAEFDALTRGSQVADSSAPVRSPLLRPQEPEAHTPTVVLPAQHASAPAPQPVVSAPAARAVEEPSVQLSPAERPAWSPPVGHWSIQGDIDDESQPLENAINRTIGSGSSTTNALVLPTFPLPSDMSNVLTSTGEVMLTGSIDLPRSLGSTGASSRIDDGIDSLFDVDDEITSTDSAPVRAIRAISTHNSNGHSVTHTQKPKGNRMLTALIVSACAMAVVAIGLFITAMAFNVF